jgi:hypothetical protein
MMARRRLCGGGEEGIVSGSTSISLKCSWVQMRGGASCMTGSPLSSALQYLCRASRCARKQLCCRGGRVQAVVEQGLGQEAAQQLLALVAVERLARLPVLDHLDAPEEAGAPDVADDGDVIQLLEGLLERNLQD